MWRDYRQKSPSISSLNPRLRLFAALVFLLLAAIIYRLYFLQIAQGDWYSALASGQHQISSLLQPARGKIMLHEKLNGQDQLYPLATNKDFSFLYAVPKDIKNPRDLADKLFDFFDKPELEAKAKLELETESKNNLQKEIDFINASEYSAEDKAARIKAAQDLAAAKKGNTDWREMQEILLDRLLKEKRDEAIAAYLKKLDKPGDPYEPLRDKLDDDTLLSLYAFLGSSAERPVASSDLERRLEKVVFKDSDEELKIEGIAFNLQSYRFYPENNMAANIVGFVGMANDKVSGRYGLEEFFNDELAGQAGYLKGERGVSNTIIVNDREYTRPEDGSDLILTMDRSAQFQACSYLEETVAKFKAEGGSVIAVNAKTGAILAMCSVPNFNPNNYKDVGDIKVYNNPAIIYQYEPGSVFKVITMAAAVDQGKVSPSTTYKDEGQIMIKGWPKPISNSDFSTKGAHGIVDMNAVLENSLNTGAIFAMRQIGAETFSDYVKNFGFGEKSGVELGSESAGNIDNLLKNNIREIDAATASFGQGIAVTPLQMLMSYQALANQGELMKPYIVQEIRHSNGQVDEFKPHSLRQVVSGQTANTILAMLVNVVESGHAKGAQIPGYYIGGKTGTAQVATSGGYSTDKFIHTFIGIVPIDNPQIVMLTKIDAPKGAAYAESTAVPLWHDIADFLLKYYQIPKTRK
ncbi:MAG: penicillin-binding protein 2 [Patescibacteria group bacterium]|nr:penicillin-binding protein 2 [Patescibacteria group bacterium]